jgi:hypothetical protein
VVSLYVRRLVPLPRGCRGLRRGSMAIVSTSSALNDSKFVNLIALVGSVEDAGT